MQIQRHWHQNYRSLGLPARIKGQKIIHKGSLNRRIAECRQSAEVLRDRFRAWLNSESFQAIDRRLREALNHDDVIRFLIRTDDLNLQKLPWHEWDFFERYPKAEVALSAPEYEAVSNRSAPLGKERARVLAILGNSRGIQLEPDRAILEQLPHADIEFLVEPERQQLSERLWQESWDILFFAGHSETEGEAGRLYINQTDSFTLSELKYGLHKAIDRGLQLAYRFLHKVGIQPLQVTPNQQWQFGSVVFHPLPTRFVGYQTLEGVNQIMLNYRTAPPGQQVSLQQVLSGQRTAARLHKSTLLERVKSWGLVTASSHSVGCVCNGCSYRTLSTV